MRSTRGLHQPLAVTLLLGGCARCLLDRCLCTQEASLGGSLTIGKSQLLVDHYRPVMNNVLEGCAVNVLLTFGGNQPEVLRGLLRHAISGALTYLHCFC
jgi:hypothetical protein